MSFKPTNATVWTEIPVTDLDKAITFYSKVLDIEMTKDETGPQPIAFFPTLDPMNGVAGHLYEGTPAHDKSGPTVHLAIPGALEEAKSRLRDQGGIADDDVITIPAGRFSYATDPDGNNISLFEAS